VNKETAPACGRAEAASVETPTGLADRIKSPAHSRRAKVSNRIYFAVGDRDRQMACLRRRRRAQDGHRDIDGAEIADWVLFAANIKRPDKAALADMIGTVNSSLNQAGRGVPSPTKAAQRGGL
jgi:hypothetical protein